MLTQALAVQATVQRIGLDTSAGLEAALLEGPYHPAFGALVKEELRARQLAALLEDARAAAGDELLLYAAAQDISLLYGQKRQRWLRLAQQFPRLRIVRSKELLPGCLLLQREGQTYRLDEGEYCRRACR